MTELIKNLAKIKNGETSVRELTQESLKKISEQKDLNAFISVFDESALKKADEIDAKLKEGKAGSLAGCIIAIKDNMCTDNGTTTCASKILENFEAPYKATAIEKLDTADAVVIGKTNLDEFAMGSSNENSFYGPVKNPINKEYVPGGSSGGSAAAVAAGMVPVSLGSDTGGSIRQPAAYCGIQSIKPTYGRISRFGLVAFASSLDQIGPFATSIEDLAEILKAISGHDHRDSTSADVEVPDFTAEIKKDTPKFKIGFPEALLTNGIDKEIKDSIYELVDKLTNDGHEIENVELPNSKYAIETYYIIANAEASSNLERYDGVRYGHRSEGVKDLNEMYVASRSEGFGEEVKRRIILGTYVLNSGYFDEYYTKAQKVRRLIYNDFKTAFEKFDMVLSPTTPTSPFKIGEKVNDPIAMYLNDIFTIPTNLAGLPALAMPYGKGKNGFPPGIQLIGKHFDETSILQLGKHIQNHLS